MSSTWAVEAEQSLGRPPSPFFPAPFWEFVLYVCLFGQLAAFPGCTPRGLAARMTKSGTAGKPTRAHQSVIDHHQMKNGLIFLCGMPSELSCLRQANPMILMRVMRALDYSLQRNNSPNKSPRHAAFPPRVSLLLPPS